MQVLVLLIFFFEHRPDVCSASQALKVLNIFNRTQNFTADFSLMKSILNENLYKSRNIWKKKSESFSHLFNFV